MNKKIICYIQAFNCEKTIEAAMESVLNQTYENWLCFVLSNGNGTNFRNIALINGTVDNSSDIIKAFAAKDKRFIVLNKKENNIDMYISMLYHLSQNFPNSYICSLDSDDEYEEDFFQRALQFAEENELDVAACGSEIRLKKSPGAKRETLIGKRELKENLIVKSENFTEKFIIYKPFFNEMWGKLYNTNLFQDKSKFNDKLAGKNIWGSFLPDSIFTINALSNCGAFGILSGTSHKFYQFVRRDKTNATVIANSVIANRRIKFTFNNLIKYLTIYRHQVFSVYKTHKIFMDFLSSHGEISDELNEYMRAILFGWFKDYRSRVILETTDIALLSKHVYSLVFDDKFDEIMRYKGSGRYNNLKDYSERKDFVENLHDMMLCQEKLENGKCTSRVKHKIDKILAKLKQTSANLSELQLKGE
jgi:glycosyltransferase involved in cell wall biosynthesis